MVALELLLSGVIGGYLILKWLFVRVSLLCALPVLTVVYLSVCGKYFFCRPLDSTHTFFLVEAWERVYNHAKKYRETYVGIGLMTVIIVLFLVYPFNF